MQCPSCGAEVPEGTRRCPGCYEWLGEEAPEAPVQRLPREGRSQSAHEVLAWLALACSSIGTLMLLWLVLNEWFNFSSLDDSEWWLAPLAGPVGIVLSGISLSLGRYQERGPWRVAALWGLWLGLVLVVAPLAFLVWLAWAFLAYLASGG